MLRDSCGWPRVVLFRNNRRKSRQSVLRVGCFVSACPCKLSVFCLFHSEASVLLLSGLEYFFNIYYCCIIHWCCYWYQRCHVFAVNIVSWFMFVQMNAWLCVCVCVCLNEWIIHATVSAPSRCMYSRLYTHLYVSPIIPIRVGNLSNHHVTLKLTQTYQILVLLFIAPWGGELLHSHTHSVHVVLWAVRNTFFFFSNTSVALPSPCLPALAVKSSI